VEICPGSYEPRRPEATVLYQVVQDGLETLYGAIDDGALAVRLPKHEDARQLHGGAEIAASWLGWRQHVAPH
jgi:hypothetical protein